MDYCGNILNHQHCPVRTVQERVLWRRQETIKKMNLRLLEMITKQVVISQRRVLKCMKTFYIIPSVDSLSMSLKVLNLLQTVLINEDIFKA